MAKEPLTTANNIIDIGSTNVSKKKKVEHGVWMDISSFRKIEPLLV